MFKSYLTLLTALLAVTMAMAGPVTKEQARQAAAAFAQKGGHSLSLAKNSFHKAQSLVGKANSPYYVFDMENKTGFVIVSGDDRTKTILGYTDSGSYDENNIPDNMKAFLGFYADVINHLDSIESAPSVPTVAKVQGVPTSGVPASGGAISPLLQSLWNQGAPYWNKCPLHNNQRCYTGCTATAFAQVMYYHRWPQSATTTIPAYTDQDNGVTYQMAQLGSVTFNWNGMQNTYNGDVNGDAVSTLMQYVGQGAQMHYTPGGSGASFANAINALKNYFGYDSQLHEIWRDNGYTDSQWEDAVYNELSYGRPVLYEGYSDTNYGGGHAFVADGYDGAGCFHINWGWGGMCNGYFSLAVLNPNDDSGMGAAIGSGGYYWHQGAVLGVKPSGSNLTTDRGVATFYQDINYGGYSISLPEGSFTTSQMAEYGISNNDITSLKMLPGFKVTLYDNDNCTGTSVTLTAETTFVGNDWNDKTSSIKIEPNGVTGLSGTYKLQNRNSGKYLDLNGNSTADNTAIVQWDDEGTEAYQQWTLTEVQTGVYTIQAASTTSKGFDVAYAAVANSTQVLLYPYSGGTHQQFILVDKGNGYYQFVAHHCGKVVEIPNASTTSGEWIKLWENNGSNTQQWLLKHNQIEGVGIATFYSNINYGGTGTALSEGTYNTLQMKMYGIKDNDISSLKVRPGFKVTAYVDDNLSGESISYTADNTWIGTQWNDKFSSLKIEAQGVSGLNGKYRLQGYNSHLYWAIKDASLSDDVMLVQKSDNVSASQEFRLSEISNGIYSVINMNSGKYIDVQAASIENRANIIQCPYYQNNKNQQWILVSKGDGYYQLVARHCGKVVEVPNNWTNDGDELKTWDNNDQKCSWWNLSAVSTVYETDLTDNGGSQAASHASVNSNESLSKLFDNNGQTKYCAFKDAGAPVWMQYGVSSPTRIVKYSLTSGNDAQGRDPKSWQLQGSTDGQNWTAIDSRSNEVFIERNQRKWYSVSNTGSYNYFRLYVTEQYDNSVTVFQLSELSLFAPTVSVPMETDINSVSTDTKLKFYPNPATDCIYVDNAEGENLFVFNTVGTMMMTTTLGDAHQRVDVSSLPKGTYVVRVGSKASLMMKK